MCLSVGFVPVSRCSLFKLNPSLGHNSISGTIIPKDSELRLSSIKGMPVELPVELPVYSNKLTGNIPTQFTALTAMTYFDVSHNTLSKAIPTTLGAWGKAVGDKG